MKKKTLILIFALIFHSTQTGWCEVDRTKAVIHHTASHDVSAKVIDRWHKERGWSGIGYHFVIRKNGNIEEGRPLTKHGAHARTGKPYSRNHYVGIALTGYDKFTQKQIQSLIRLIKKIGITQIERHHKKCPGKGLDVEGIQKRIRKVKVLSQ